MRLFVGIPLPATLIDELSAVSMRLQSGADGLRWSAPESWHITLQFLGNTAEQRYECIVTQLRDLRAKPVPIQLEELGCFERAGVFFTGVRCTEELILLQQRVTVATGHCGFVPETRPYHPHITLARRKARAGGFTELKSKIRRQPNFSDFVADEFVLYESVVRPRGSHYEVRERFRLDVRV
jgi:2'-5' RNA ligase